MPLLLLASHASALPLTTDRPESRDPPVRVSLSSDGKYRYGDRAKVYAKTADNGYLVVLRATADGRVRVLFPLDPGDDQRVTGGKKYEIKGRGGREAFMVDDSGGHGTVLAAYSRTPFRFDQFVKDGLWDYAALSGGGKGIRDVEETDPEAHLTDVVRRMLPAGEHFDYDIASYVVVRGPRYAGYYPYGYPYPYPYYWPGWWGYGFGPRVALGFGFGFGPRFHHGFRGWRW